ncbi:tetratricopeptide repeat protein [Photobacterium damselae subsp. piscicida]|uniref:tetratricopeptide repeat protein n=1 Tax=Photobacterium damselae TaxID=38293 RepID=UPI00031856E5|nr:tetratricopeptide repeat protein [Photobacterium damselae]TFZ62559.1 tetratricopeptide repeat protein [Photobacterium damselae subsp. piscicida]TJZ85058.1 tetratricopeptide repeat protein [Photobacterium damselae subsp. piscicida]
MMKIKKPLVSVLLLSASILPCWVQAAPQLSQSVAAKLQKANTLMQEDKLTQASQLLTSIAVDKAYDKAFIARMLGVVYWQQGKTQSAIKALTQAVNSGLLKDEYGWQTERMLADLLLSEQQYNKALPHYYSLAQVKAKGNKTDEVWLRIAQSHYQLSQWPKVLTAIKRYDSYGNKDSVSPLSIALGAQLQLKKYNLAVPTLNRLIALEPNKNIWWQQLASLQIRIGKTSDALDTLVLAQHQGIQFSNNELRTLAQLYAQRGIPERAAKIIATLSDANTQERLVEQANYWQMAREWDKAITVWKKAVSLNSKYRWQLAQLQLQQGQYRQALSQLNQISNSKYQSQVELAKVRAYYKLDKLEKAIIHAKMANNLKPSQEAKGWIQYLSQMQTMS